MSARLLKYCLVALFYSLSMTISMNASAVSTTTPAPVTISPTSVPTVTANKQWKPVVQSFAGVEMALVPPGCFTMGSVSDGDEGTVSDGVDRERPTTQLCFDKPFWIDKYEVANGQFVRLGGQAEHESSWTGGNRPRENITWFEARAFCTKRESRLPTEAEWEYAARGPDNLIYPWGNDFDGTKVVFYDDNNPDFDYQTADVGSKPGGVSWVGALDMGGNVSEWVNSIYMPYPYNANDGREKDTIGEHALRGSSWSSVDAYFFRTAFRGWWLPSRFGDWLGFRCARSY